ncbi:DUF2382 domain-containing protein [Salinicoccus roseus]|uniref:DUF2382 domain-containing protein n=1 Tax=Salinicoccus roseus TaxID=45670 RepID=UPI003564B7C5
MRKIETFNTEQEAVSRIDQLKTEGVEENQITIVSNRDLEAGGAFGDYSGVKVKSSEGSAWDKVVSFFTGDAPEEQAVNNMNLTAAEEQEYREALDADKILLYVDGTATVEGQGTGVAGGPAAGTTGAYAERDDRDITDRNRADRDVTTDEESLKLHEERLNVDKEKVKTGEVNIDKHTETERQEFDVPVEREEVTVERRPVDGDRPVRDGEIGDDNDSIRVPVNEERVNVSKEDVVSEEVVVKKDKVRDTEHVSEDVRREDVDIDENATGRTTGRTGRDGLRDEDETLKDGLTDDPRRDDRI